ncbi:integrase, catalytic region, zinc finger, CCHC-type containing protein [Tanacetum coccineum]|uniref:Integrase, catalytic region, zinc finger, CCHC-type containing protein n=1 Tax=Tanacetum coccineum TaxID=301880 RepID=A0ABQ5GTU5_9ASTR
MSSNSDDIQAAGSDTRPPMLDRTDYESWSQRIRLYCRGKENGLQILQSIDQGPFELGTTRDALGTTPEGGVLLGPERPRTYEDLSDTEKKRYDADVRATNIVLQGLPKDIYKLINHNIEAKAPPLLDTSKGFWLDLKEDNFVQADECDAFDSEGDEEPRLKYAIDLRVALAVDIWQDPSIVGSIFTLNSVCVSPVNDAFVPHDPIATEFKIYKETGAHNLFYLRQAKKAQPALYDGDELLKPHHVPVTVSTSEEELELAEATRNKCMWKMITSVCVERAKRKAEELKVNATPLPVLPPATVYPPNTLAYLVPRTLPTTSQVYIGLEFKSLVTEVRAMKVVFENLEAEVDQNETDLRSGEIERKNLLITQIENLVAGMAEMKSLSNHYKELYDSIKNNVVAKTTDQQQLFGLSKIKNTYGSTKEYSKCVSIPDCKPKVMAPGRYPIDVESIFPSTQEEWGSASTLYRRLKEMVETLREIVEDAKVERPLDTSLAFACRYTKHSQELSKKQSSATKVWRVKHVKQVWKATGKLFTTIGHQVRDPHWSVSFPLGDQWPLTRNTPPKVLPTKQWKPTGRLLPLGRQCPLVRLLQIVHWYLDTGCSKHYVGECSQLRIAVKKFIGTVRFGNDHFGAIMGYGEYFIGDSVISMVYYVEGLGHNLFSVGQFCDSDLEVAFRKHTCFVRDLEGVDLIKGSRGTNLYTISVEDMMRSSPICLLSKASKNKSWLWPRRLNHLNFSTLNDLARKDLVLEDEGLPFCNQSLKQFKSGLNKTVRFVRTDNGKEFVNKNLTDFYESVGITHEKTVLRTPQQNGVVERRNRTLVEVARTNADIIKGLPCSLWAEAVATACYTQNRSLIHTLYNKTPYELVHDKKSDLSFLHIFGALYYPTNDSEDLGKLKAKADIGFFVGYAPNRKGYRIYNKRTRQIMETIHVTFDELTEQTAPVHSSSGPNPNLLTPGPISSGLVPNSDPAIRYVPPTNKYLELLFQPMFDEYFETPTGDHQMPHVPAVPPPVIPTGPSVSISFDHDAPSGSHSPSSSAPQSSSVHHVLSKVEPKTFKSAVTEDCWFQAMQDEIHEFDRLDVWELVPPPDCGMIIALK